MLTSTGLQSYTSHTLGRASPWCRGRCCHGAGWPFWWPHLRVPGRPPGPGSPVSAVGWGRTQWPGFQHPSCSHRCTGKGCRNVGNVAKLYLFTIKLLIIKTERNTEFRNLKSMTPLLMFHCTHVSKY